MKYLDARNRLMVAIMPESESVGLCRPIGNGCCVAPVVNVPGRPSWQVCDVHVKEWLADLQHLTLSTVMWNEMVQLNTSPLDFLLDRGLHALSRHSTHVLRSTEYERVPCVAAFVGDGFAAARMLLPNLFVKARRMLGHAGPELYAAIPCRDVLCIFRHMPDAARCAVDARMHVDSCVAISREPFVLTLDGVAGSEQERRAANAAD